MPADWYDENKGRAKKDFNRASQDDNKGSEKIAQEDKGQGKGSEMVEKDRPVDYPHPNGPTYNASNAAVYKQRLQKEREDARPPDAPDDSKPSYVEQQRMERDASKNKTQQPGKTPGSYDSFYDEQKDRAKTDFNQAAQKGRANKPK